MKKVLVSERAIRELIRGALTNRKSITEGPVDVNDVVDPSAALTDPGNEKYRPDSPAELQVALKTLTDDLPQDKIPDIYEKLLGAIKDLDKDEDTMKKESKVESIIRAHVRRHLREAAPRGLDDFDDDKRGYTSVADVEGDSLEDIARDLGFSISGAKAAVDKAVAKAQWVASMQLGDPEEVEVMVLTAMNDYINLLNKSGELTAADVQLLKDHPDIVRTLDGFREFLDKYVRRARKARPGGFPIRKGDIQWPDRPGDEQT